MTISIWRYSHLALAVSSFLFLILASLTGVILTFKPLSEKTQPYSIPEFNQLTVAQTIPVLRKVYPGISLLSVDANQFVKIQGTDVSGKKLLAYVDPTTGKILGIPREPNEFFQWITALHRSLFLHETGRFFVGLTAFLLFLSTLSGTILVVQRQRGIKRFFNKIVKENFSQYYHVVLGRWSLIPILIIAMSGTYLSLGRFGLFNIKKDSLQVDFDAISASPLKKDIDFEVFKRTRLSEVEEIEFPFSEDVEDYYTLKLKGGTLAINQITGDILAETKYSTAVTLTDLSLNMHTGRSSGLWAIVLGVASLNILFFIYSGFAITLKRRANRIKNKFSPSESRFIILVGSENGSTFSFAQIIYKQLVTAGERPYLAELNNYTVYPKAEYFIVLTATYGLGDAPTNAAKFLDLLEQHPQSQTVHYSILGFGSHAYPDFCKFAFEISNAFSHQTWAKQLTDVHTVNDKSPDDFSLWAESWVQQADLQLIFPPLSSGIKKDSLMTFTVDNSSSNPAGNDMFTISFKAEGKLRAKSGDLLAIYPKDDHRERLYSIGLVSNKIRLSVKLFPTGLGSVFLSELNNGEQIRAKIIKNKHFHFPKTVPEALLISNGTGIAPFLGMISENKQQIPCHLFCGFRDNVSFAMYQAFLEENQELGRLNKLHVAFSRQGQKQYVSDLIQKEKNLVSSILKRGGVLMICGSLAMLKDVIEQINIICEEENNVGVSYYQSRNQIRTDCY
jgi:sulfite reductase (NADPH) flavoprotein alpha-component